MNDPKTCVQPNCQIVEMFSRDVLFRAMCRRVRCNPNVAFLRRIARYNEIVDIAISLQKQLLDMHQCVERLANLVDLVRAERRQPATQGFERFAEITQILGSRRGLLPSLLGFISSGRARRHSATRYSRCAAYITT